MPVQAFWTENGPSLPSHSAWSPNADIGEQFEFSILFVACQSKDLELWNENRFQDAANMQKEVVLAMSTSELVKFTRRHWPKLHHLCAERDDAPKLLGYGTVQRCDTPQESTSMHWTQREKEFHTQ
jgi:hypothetical protein